MTGRTALPVGVGAAESVACSVAIVIGTEARPPCRNWCLTIAARYWYAPT